MAKASDNVFPRFLISEGGSTTTPAAGRVTVYAKADGLLYQKDDAGTETLLANVAAGSVATDAIWDAAGDLAQGTGANTAAKLSAGLAGQVLRSAGAAAANTWAYPPGYEYDYVAITSAVTVTATTEAGATTVVTGNAVTYDGSTIVVIEFYCPYLYISTNTAGKGIYLWLYDGASSIGQLSYTDQQVAAVDLYHGPVHPAHRLMPSAAAHTYSIRASKDSGGTTTAQVNAGAGGAGASMPAFIRITKV